MRKAFREGLKKILTRRAGLRALGELASNIDPIGPAEIGDAMGVEQLAEMAAQATKIGKEAEVALDFVKQGPRNLEDLYASNKYEDFKSYDEFRKSDDDEEVDLEKKFGSAGDGYDWHHLAEQRANEQTLSLREVNSTTNIVRIPRMIHEIINSEYASDKPLNGVTQSLRASLRGGDFEAHRQAGIEALRRYGIIN